MGHSCGQSNSRSWRNRFNVQDQTCQSLHMPRMPSDGQLCIPPNCKPPGQEQDQARLVWRKVSPWNRPQPCSGRLLQSPSRDWTMKHHINVTEKSLLLQDLHQQISPELEFPSRSLKMLVSTCHQRSPFQCLFLLQRHLSASFFKLDQWPGVVTTPTA